MLANDPVVKELVRARIQLMMAQPLFGQIILQLELKEVDWCPTAATDGRYFYYNREFIKSLTRKEVIWLTAHEVLHCVFDHMFRRGKRDKQLFNTAADFIVDYVLEHGNIGTPIKGRLYDPAYTDEFSVEELYTLLEQKQVKAQSPIDMHLDGSGGDDADGDGESSEVISQGGASSGDDGPPVLSEEEQQQIRDNLRAALIQAAQISDPGKLPAGLRRMIDRLLRPKIDWRQMLDNTLRSTIKYDYTYSRMSRRTWSSGLVLPGQDVMDRVEAVALLDGSASTTRKMVTEFLSECKGIMQTFHDFKLIVMTFDTEVYNVVEYTPENAAEIDHYDLKGGGGTAPSCCWAYMAKNDIHPDRLLVFTDGEVGGDWGMKDYADTLFIIHSNPGVTASYGTTVHYVSAP